MRKVAPVIAALSLSAFALLGLAVTAATADESSSPAAVSDEGSKAEAAKKVVGELTAVDADAKTLSVKSGEKVQNFVLDQAATLTDDGKPIQLTDLKVGEKVEVSFKVSGFTMTATRVEVLS